MLSLILFALAAPDQLAELTRSSRELRSFTAVFELSSGQDSGVSTLRIDYAAPARVRVEHSFGPEVRLSTWCVDGVLAVDDGKTQPRSHGRVDHAAILAELAPLERKLHDAFPDAPAAAALASAVGMGWGLDAKSQRAQLVCEARLREPSASPLGWLELLQEQGAAAVEDGDVLRFETQGRFRVALAKDSGFVREIKDAGPEGKLKLVLVSLESNHEIEAARFVIPPAAQGAVDVSADLARGLSRLAELGLRRRIYEAIAGGEESGAWDSAVEARIESVLRPFHERVVPGTLAAWRERSRKIEAGVAERLAGMRKAGKSADEVEQSRQRELGYLGKQLDELEQGFLTRLSLPENARPLPRGALLLELEKRCLSEVFRTLVREPTLESFAKATAG